MKTIKKKSFYHKICMTQQLLLILSLTIAVKRFSLTLTSFKLFLILYQLVKELLKLKLFA